MEFDSNSKNLYIKVRIQTWLNWLVCWKYFSYGEVEQHPDGITGGW